MISRCSHVPAGRPRNRPASGRPERVAMRKKKRKSALLRVIIVLLILAIAATVAYAFVRGGGKPDFSFLTPRAGTAEEQPSGVFYFDSGRQRVCADIGGGFAVASTTGLRVFDRAGTEILDETILFTSPAIVSGGGYGAVYDLGGTSLQVFDATGLLWELTAENDIVSCSISSTGLVSLITGESGYKTSLTVYDTTGEAVYKWFSGDGYAIASGISPNGRSMCAAALCDSGSRVVFYDLDSEVEKSSCVLPGQVALDLRQTEPYRALVLTTGGVWRVSEGEAELVYDFEGRYLSNYAMAPDGLTIVSLLDYSVGSSGRLVSLSASGGVMGEAETKKAVASLSAGGGMYAVLWSDGLTVFDRKLQESYSANVPTGVDTVIMREGGAVLAVAASYATLVER